MVQAGLIEDCNTKIFLLSIWLWHLQESINFANCRDVVRNEGLDLCVQINFLGLIALNVIKHVLELLRNW